jgi:hypothetical protein
MMLHLLHDLHCIFILHWGAWRWRCRLGDAKNFKKILRKLVKPFSKAGAKKRDGAKIFLVEDNLWKYDSSN